MKYVVLLFPLSLCLRTFSQKTKFSIEGNTFHKNGMVRLLILNQRQQYTVFDSSKINDGHFKMSGSLDEPHHFSLEIEAEEKQLLIGNENIVVTQTDSTTKAISVAGSSLTEEEESYDIKYKQPIVRAYINIENEITTLDSTNLRTIDSLRKIQTSLLSNVPNQSLEFVNRYPSSFFSLHLLNYYGDNYPVDTLKYYYSKLDSQLKRYPSAKFIEQKILLGLNKSFKCPNFKVLDTANKILSLKTFKGNYLLIDFWASWCVPCVENIPYVQQAAVQFVNKNFKVLTVSMDNKEQAWKSALVKYQLNGTCKNVLLPNAFRHPMALQFNVSAIPTNVLINPKGEIIAKNIGGTELLDKLEAVFDTK